MGNSPSIHILDDDSLLNIFYLYRPFLLGEDQDVNVRFQGGAQWVGECWWYRLAQVCQRWRNLIDGLTLGPQLSILPGPLSCVYMVHMTRLYGTLTTPSTFHRLHG